MILLQGGLKLGMTVRLVLQHIDGDEHVKHLFHDMYLA